MSFEQLDRRRARRTRWIVGGGLGIFVLLWLLGGTCNWGESLAESVERDLRQRAAENAEATETDRGSERVLASESARKVADRLGLVSITLDSVRRVVPEASQGAVRSACRQYEYLTNAAAGLHGAELQARHVELLWRAMQDFTDTQARVFGVLLSVESRGGGQWQTGSQAVVDDCHRIAQ